MKNRGLRRLLLLMPLALAACTAGENGRSYLEAFPDRFTGSRRDMKDGRPAPAPMDTVIYVAAVAFPEGYDWRRDTSYGSVQGRLVLYRDGEQALSVHAGAGSRASLDHDLHHLVDGHLYTEYCTEDGTIIGRDGEELFSYPGREFLCGLLVEGNDVLTLGQSRSGGGFSLRRNGGELMSVKEATVASHLQDNSRYPSGALYRDSGHLYFSYFKDEPQGGGRSWYIVEDGTETRVDAAGEGMFDIRVKEGELSVKAVDAGRDWWYNDGKRYAWVKTLPSGGLAVHAPCSVTLIYLDPFYLPSFSNACLAGRHFYMGMNPPDGGRPWLWKDREKVYELDINGFITAVGFAEEPRREGS